MVELLQERTTGRVKLVLAAPIKKLFFLDFIFKSKLVFYE
jgi:hypothetical protein